MSSSSGDLERLWIEEVRYLHSLWRSGPPPNRSRNPNSTPTLRPSHTPTFKKEKKRKRNNNKNKKNENEEEGTIPATISGVEWTKESSPPRLPSNVTWEEAAAAAPSLEERSAPSAEEAGRWAAIRLQRGAARACNELLAAIDDEGEDEDGDETERAGEDKAFLFFLEFFRREEDVRRFYEGNWEKGEFVCPVCLGVGKRLKRTYCSCISLVQHATAVLKTKTRDAHRAYARAICRVLGWDISRLPSIVLDLQGPLCPSAAPDPNSLVASAEDTAIKQTGSPSAVNVASRGNITEASAGDGDGLFVG